MTIGIQIVRIQPDLRSALVVAGETRDGRYTGKGGCVLVRRKGLGDRQVEISEESGIGMPARKEVNYT
jgi:hypothetical protein